jgi:hypothetical protein
MSMGPSDAGRPRSQWLRNSFHLARWNCLVSLAAGAITFVMVWCQNRWQVLHPHYLPFVVLITIMTVATAVTLLSGLWQVLQGPRRIIALTWVVLALVWPAFFSFVGLYAMAQWQERWVPNNLPMNLAKLMGVTMMRLEASLEYPSRLETHRLVMFYNRLDHPQQDIQVMDRHLAAMETMLAGSLRGKVFWVRGRLPILGLGGLSTHGIALGSDTSPPDWQRHGGFDRHELAHAAIDQFRTPGADPPYVLHEGWAQARNGDTSAALARAALEQRAANPAISLRELLGPDWYHRDLGPVYSIGGAFVDFMIRNHGTGKFLRYYNECRPESFDALFRDVYGQGIDDLEVEFWKDAASQAAERRDLRSAKGTAETTSPPRIASVLGSGTLCTTLTASMPTSND